MHTVQQPKLAETHPGRVPRNKDLHAMNTAHFDLEQTEGVDVGGRSGPIRRRRNKRYIPQLAAVRDPNHRNVLVD